MQFADPVLVLYNSHLPSTYPCEEEDNHNCEDEVPWACIHHAFEALYVDDPTPLSTASGPDGHDLFPSGQMAFGWTHYSSILLQSCTSLLKASSHNECPDDAWPTTMISGGCNYLPYNNTVKNILAKRHSKNTIAECNDFFRLLSC